MASLGIDPGLRPFNESGYEVRDGELDRTREVVIGSADPFTPHLGDLFTVERRGVVAEVAVVRLTALPRGWRAVCRVTDVF